MSEIVTVRPKDGQPFRAEVLETFCDGQITRVRILPGEPNYVDTTSPYWQRKRTGESAAEHTARLDTANVWDVGTVRIQRDA